MNTSNMGRPAGTKNEDVIINWVGLCRTLRHEPEFFVPDNNSYIRYVNGNDAIAIVNAGDNKYDLTYERLKNGEVEETIKCQQLRNGKELDRLLLGLMSEQYDWVLTGVIKTIKV